MDTTDPPLDPAEMCELVGRLIFRGLPVPASVYLGAGYVRPRVQVMASAIDEWVEQTAADGEWEVVGNQEHYHGHADGFDLIAVRDHVCEPVR